MSPGYLKFGLLVLTSLLVVVTANTWNYSDVDLRIAERKSIPHYRRHSFEYADIDIKAIMRQRGLLPQNGEAYKPVNVLPKVTQEPWLWYNRDERIRNSRKKYLDQSNHIDVDDRYGKKYKYYSKFGNKYGIKYRKQRYN